MNFYAAFISYSHAKDKPIAAALQSVTQRLGKAWYQRRAARIFRDDASLSASPHLWPVIERALDQSGLFILLASPEASTSKWVNREVTYWLEHKGIDTLLIGLTGGELSWDDQSNDFVRGEANPLPPALAGRFSSVPRWVDLRPFRDGDSLGSSNFIDASAEFAAAIRNVPKEDLLSLEVRQQRRALALAWSASALLLTLAVVATAFAVLAFSAERHATNNYAAAKEAADNLVRSIAGELRQQKGISTSTLDIAFNSVDRLIQRMEQAVAQQDSFLARELRPGFTWVERVLTGKAVAGDEGTALEMSRATLLYEFAETYHQSAGDIGAARAKAEQSLSIRSRMRGAGNDTPDLQEQIAKTEIELGDLSRQKIERAASVKSDAPHGSSASVSRRRRPRVVLLYASTRKRYEAAVALLEALVSRFPDRVEFTREYGQTLTRLGDLDIKAGDRASAERRYRTLLEAAIKVFRQTPDDKAIRELGWGFRKLGESQSDAAAATIYFADEVCVRRKLVEASSSNALYAQDLGYSLTRLGDAKMRLKPPDLQGAEDAYFEALHLRLQAVTAKLEAGTLGEFAHALTHVGEIRRARGDVMAADYYTSAAADVKRALREAFAELPSDPSQRAATQRLATERRERGPLAMIEASSIQLEDDDREFEIVRLGEIQRGAQGCWGALRARVESGAPLASTRP
jgi:tetratricopeptide (TPR) repeat protein